MALISGFFEVSWLDRYKREFLKLFLANLNLYSDSAIIRLNYVPILTVLL